MSTERTNPDSKPYIDCSRNELLNECYRLRHFTDILAEWKTDLEAIRDVNLHPTPMSDCERVAKMSRIAVAALGLLLSGCVLAPNTLSPEIEHVSHASQQEPFTTHPTRYGYNEIALQARWGHATGPFLEMAEGYNWGPRNSGGEACGGLYGGREVFSARAGYTFQIKP